MSSEAAISVTGLGKCYQIYRQPQDRLKQFLWRGRRQYFREFWALRDVNFNVMPGEVMGIVGRNGSGKSTLLQLVCGTLTPTQGEVRVEGRIAALLELGAGFNPEFTGRENVFMSAALMGMGKEEVEARFDEIAAFADIGDFIEQPVKTYSSGMYVRLAFAVAVNIDPDILVIDEALSVGDGEFSRKSFDRIMKFKKEGKTILFCSHALYQVEALCSRAIWVADGRVRMDGQPAKVVAAYNEFLAAGQPRQEVLPQETAVQPAPSIRGTARITGIELSVNGATGKKLEAKSGESEVAVRVKFAADQALPAPSVGVCFAGQDGRIVTSAGTHIDGFAPLRHEDGSGEVTAVFPKFSLLKGNYWVEVYLLCEAGIHVYDSAAMAAELDVSQPGMELGVVALPHTWKR